MMKQQQAPANQIMVFYSYAHKDEWLRNELEKHLSSLRLQGLISEWHDRQIVPGTDWACEMDAHLINAAIILLLISPDFLASDYCCGIEMQRALARHKTGEACVIPIILRPVDWEKAPFAKLQCLPRDGKAVTSWDNLDAAFLDVVKGIRRAIERLPAIVSSSPPSSMHSTEGERSESREAACSCHPGVQPSTPGFQGNLSPKTSQPQGVWDFFVQWRLRLLLLIVALLTVFGAAILFEHISQFGTFDRPQPTVTATVQDLLSATETARANATATTQASMAATATAFQNSYIQATSRVPTIMDPLSAQDSLRWDTYSPPAASSGSCLFQNGAYYATATRGNSTSCEATVPSFKDLALQAEVTVLHGNGGLIFRSNSQENSFYAFCITADGGYFLEKSSPSSNVQDYTVLINGNSSSIVRGSNQSNLLTVIARGMIFSLYVNRHYVGSVSDQSDGSGAIGVFTNSSSVDGSVVVNTTEAAFKNLKVWKL